MFASFIDKPESKLQVGSKYLLINFECFTQGYVLLTFVPFLTLTMVDILSL